MHKVLAIETSCDETSLSIVSNIGDTFRIHSNIIASQIEDHSKWGGVVPELAARKHLELLPFVLDKALEESKINELLTKYNRFNQVAIKFGTKEESLPLKEDADKDANPETVTVFPNPASSEIHLNMDTSFDLGSYEVQIYNLDSAMVYHNTIN